MLRSTCARIFNWGGKKLNVSPRNVILITGCDSGLGYALSVFCHSLNMTVISACHNINSVGARSLQNLNDSKRIITIELDLLKPDTIQNAQQRIKELIDDNSYYQFTALVNNAGMMCFGEYEWQTWKQIEMQFNVNLLGTLRLSKELLPIIRQYKARIINITSHCSLMALPSLSPYAASKAGVRFWNDSLRIEMQKYGVEVINFVPGSFVMSSNIAARQQDHAREMAANFSTEQHKFYDDYFERFNQHLKIISGFKAPNQMQDRELLKKFEHALTNAHPKPLYIHEPWRYKIYRLLSQWCPPVIMDILILKFVDMPTYHQPTEEQEESLKTKSLKIEKS
uniref:Uncharacterized protein n=1 Tax=Glossina pallidipes TaxID=7398 RepID=A0A1B0A8W3_GLOPL